MRSSETRETEKQREAPPVPPQKVGESSRPRKAAAANSHGKKAKRPAKEDDYTLHASLQRKKTSSFHVREMMKVQI